MDWIGATKLIDVAHDASPHFHDIRVILRRVLPDQHSSANLQEFHWAGQLGRAEDGQAGQG